MELRGASSRIVGAGWPCGPRAHVTRPRPRAGGGTPSPKKKPTGGRDARPRRGAAAGSINGRRE
eukprot:2234653-Prymnesium_polylepis.1